MLRGTALRCKKARWTGPGGPPKNPTNYKLAASQMPMLAHKWLDFKPPGPYFVSPKLDGIRVIATPKGFFSRRGGQLWGLDHLRKDLAPAFRADPSLVLDGELYAHYVSNAKNRIEATAMRDAATSAQAGTSSERVRFETIISMTGKLRHKYIADEPETQAQLRLLNFHVFDSVTMHAGLLKNDPGASRLDVRDDGTVTGRPIVVPEQTPFFARWLALEWLQQHRLGKATAVHLVPHVGAMTYADAEERYSTFLEGGYEGAVLRVFDQVYRPGKRSKEMVKLVPWRDAEFRLLKIERRPNWKNLRKKSCPIQSVTCLADNGVPFTCRVGVAPEEGWRWLQVEERSVGYLVTIRYPFLTAVGTPRNGVAKCIRGTKGNII